MPMSETTSFSSSTAAASDTGGDIYLSGLAATDNLVLYEFVKFPNKAAQCEGCHYVFIIKTCQMASKISQKLLYVASDLYEASGHFLKANQE